MIRRLLLGAGIPIVATGAAVGAAYSAKKFGWIEEGTWAVLWPSLIALAFLAFAIVALLMGARRWLIPLITGLVVQTLGTVLYVFDELDRSVETLLWTGLAVGIVLAGMGLYYLYRIWRARRTEDALLNPLEEEGVDPEELTKIRENMAEALDVMRRAGRGRNAVYELPWFLVVGRPSAGKTFAVKESGLGLPVKKDWVKGVGGTYSCDFFFTNEMIFMDTPGRWVRNGADDAAKRYWGTLLKLLKSNRGRRPLDGLIVVVSAEDLLGVDLDSEDQVDLQDQAANIREIIDLMHEHLRFRFPVYVIVTKSDLIGGFTGFFWGIQAQRRDEILGWSNANPNDHRAEGMIHRGLDRILPRLERYRDEMLAKLGRTSRNRQTFFFSEELRQLRGPLADFAEMLFYNDPSRQTPIFRGFYFTSAVQEGSPVSRAMSALRRNLGIPSSTAEKAAEKSESRSYFLKELFRELMVGDEGLIGRTAKHWLKQRRNTAFGAFLPAGLALTFLLLSGIALVSNRSLYNSIERRVPQIVDQLEQESQEELTQASLVRRLALTDELRVDHRKLTSLNPFRRLGMRHAEELARQVFAIYKEQLGEAVLRPTLKLAYQEAMTGICANRVDVFHSVVWLRQGRRFDSSRDNMKGFDYVWSEWELDPEEVDQLRTELLSQFRHLVVHAEDNVGTLLGGFDMALVARGILEDCPKAGAGSAIHSFCEFQKQCEGWHGHGELQECYELLRHTAEWHEEDYERYFQNIQSLEDSLESFQSEETQAEDALVYLDQLDLSEAEQSECVQKFVGLLEDLRDYAVRDEMLADCRRQVADLQPAVRIEKRSEIITAQEEELTERGEALSFELEKYETDCKSDLLDNQVRNLDFELVQQVSFSYRRQGCLGFDERPRRSAARSTGGGSAPATSAPATKRKSSSGTGGTRRTTRGSAVLAGKGSFDKFCEGVRGYSPATFHSNGRTWNAEWQATLTDPNTSESMRAGEHQKTLGKVASYGRRYVAQWLECLGQSRIAEPTVALSQWLQDLSGAPEYGQLFEKPIGEANEILGVAAADPLKAVTGEMQTLAGLQSFKDGTVPAYQEALAALAREIKLFDGSPAAFGEFRRAYRDGRTENALVAAEILVRTRVDSFAGGRFRELFAEPLNRAQAFVTGDSYLNARWAQLVRQYEQTIAGRFPFDPAGTEMVEKSALDGIFGGASGLIFQIEPGGGESGERAREWLQDARGLAKVVYQKDQDELKPLRVQVKWGGIEPSDEDLGKKFKVTKANLSLAPGVELLWETDHDDPAAKPLKVELFGEEAGTTASQKIWVAERKGKLKRMVGKDYKTPEPAEPAEEAGQWAALRLLQLGLGSAPDIQSGAATLMYSVPWKQGKKDKSFTITYDVISKNLVPVLELLDNGLDDPPRDIGE